MAGLKKLFVKTYGCQMNVYDSERMSAALAGEGYETTEHAQDADLILLNTCHIREKAGEKLYSDLGRLRAIKERRPGLRVGVAGCVAQAEGSEIMRRAPIVDLVVGPQTYHRLPRMLRAVDKGWTTCGHRFSRRGQVRPSAAAASRAACSHRFPHRSGRVRQILRLLRGAIHPRRRSFAANPKNSSRRRASLWRREFWRSIFWDRT